MRKKYSEVVVLVLILCRGVLTIPTPEGKQTREISNQKQNIEEVDTENESNAIVNGIFELIEKENQLNENLTYNIISNHEESTKNKVINQGMLVPMFKVDSDPSVSTENEFYIPDVDEAGSGYVNDKDLENSGMENENDRANKLAGNINIDDNLVESTPDDVVNQNENKSAKDTEPSKLIETEIKTETQTSNLTDTSEYQSLSSTTGSSTTASPILSLSEALIIAESDVEEDNEEEQRELCDAIPNNSILRNGLGHTGFTWPGGKIPYKIGDGFNDNDTNTIQSAIDYYNTEFEGCLQWVVRGSESNYVTFENTGTCSSRIGVAFYPFPVSQSIHLGRCSHLEGHIKHEMMHTIGFYHEHSRSDRDMYIKILWNNIPPTYHAQFSTYRWTTGYGEKYDYDSIMHYSSRAFVKDYTDKGMKSILPTDESVDVDNLGFKPNLSETDIKKIRKMYRCDPYTDYKASCSNDDNCGLNEYCAPFVGECRTKLPTGSLCVLDRECLSHCGGGVCSVCTEDNHCGDTEYCTYKYLPGIEKECSGYCGGFCLLSSQCGGDCGTCSWSFQCQ